MPSFCFRKYIYPYRKSMKVNKKTSTCQVNHPFPTKIRCQLFLELAKTHPGAAAGTGNFGACTLFNFVWAKRRKQFVYEIVFSQKRGTFWGLMMHICACFSLFLWTKNEAVWIDDFICIHKTTLVWWTSISCILIVQSSIVTQSLGSSRWYCHLHLGGSNKGSGGPQNGCFAMEG